jgi:serine/threonine protein kinase
MIPVLRYRYQVMRPIGRGGFGATYLAEDRDRRDAPCVVKQFSPSALVRNHPEALQKATELFNQEAERLLQLEGHAQIPRLFAYFEEQGKLYLVQEFIQGQTLLSELEQCQHYSDHQVETLLHDLLPVLQFIHENQVIHRDIKPENIIRRQQDGKPVLIDFGVARLVTGTILTGGATATGTPGYAPPEQMQQGKIFPASDLYSLGMTALHLLTGIYPYELYDAYSGQWMWRDRLAEQGRAVSDRVGHVLDCLTQALVKDRYVSAADALQALNTGISNIGASTPPIPPTVVPNQVDARQTQASPLTVPQAPGGVYAQNSAPIAANADELMARPVQKMAIAAGALGLVAFGVIGGVLLATPRTPVAESPTLTAPTTAQPAEPTASADPPTSDPPMADGPEKSEAIANVQAIVGSRTDGWLPAIIKDIPLQDDMLPAEVDQLMPGGGNISEFGFSEILVNDVSGLWKYRFSFPEDDDGQRRLFSLRLYFDPALRGYLSFEEFANLLSAKYGAMTPGEATDGIVIWSGPGSATATLTDGISDFDAFELNVTFP